MIQNRIEDRAGSVAPKRQRPCRHLVQHGTKREQVGTRVEVLTSNLLGRHVGHCSHRAARTCQMFLRLDGGGTQGNSLRLERDFCQPEIQDLRLASICDEDVGGFDVTMDDSFGVCGV